MSSVPSSTFLFGPYLEGLSVNCFHPSWLTAASFLRLVSTRFLADGDRSVTEIILVTTRSEEVDALAQTRPHLVLHHPLAINGGGRFTLHNNHVAHFEAMLLEHVMRESDPSNLIVFQLIIIDSVSTCCYPSSTTLSRVIFGGMQLKILPHGRHRNHNSKR